MMQKIYIIFKKYKTMIISTSIVLLIGICSLILINSFTNSSIKKVNEETYSFQYDNTWKLKAKKKDNIILKHNSGSKITIQITELPDEYRYSAINELIDELLYNIQKQNNNYKLILNKEDKFTKYQFDGYKILYENDKEQVMMVLYKKSDKLVSISYESTNDYFDILLDSVLNIIYNLDIKETKFNLKNELNLETSDISYSTSNELDELLKNSKKYEIANNNYLVEYSIPSSFIQSNFDSTLGTFNLRFKSGNIILTSNIFNRNIYEYLDKEQILNLYKNYSHYKDNSNNYSDFKETLTKLNSDYDSYIYKNSYYYKKTKRQDENIELIYALDNNHILIIKIGSTGVPITKKMVNMIKINSSKNYANYIKNKKNNNFLIGELKRFTDYNKNKIDLITLKIPNKYEELDKKSNIYLTRYYGLNYNEDMEIYDYDVRYELSNLPDKKLIDLIYIKSAYGKSQKLFYSGNLTSNGKQFKVYDGGYTDISGIIFTDTNRKKYYVNKKVLFYKMPNKGNLYIEINGNGKKITNGILKELTNFTIEEKDY